MAQFVCLTKAEVIIGKAIAGVDPKLKTADLATVLGLGDKLLKGTEKEIIPRFATLFTIHLQKASPDVIQSSIEQVITILNSAPNAMIKLKVLAELYGIFPRGSAVQYTIFFEMLVTCRDAGLTTPIQPHLEILGKTVESWTVSNAQLINLFRLASEVAEHPSLKIKLLTKLLSYEEGEGINQTVQQALKIASVDQFDKILLHPAAAKVTGDLGKVVDILTNTTDIVDLKSNAIVGEIGLDKCNERVRILILGSLEGDYTFAELSSKLGIPQDEVEDRAVYAISSKIINARIDQLNETVTVIKQRKKDAAYWGEFLGHLEKWEAFLKS